MSSQLSYRLHGREQRPKTRRKHYRDELDTGQVKASAKEPRAQVSPNRIIIALEMLAKRRGPMKGNRLINFALAAVTLLWGIPHAFWPAAAQPTSLEAPHWGEGGVPQFQIDPDWPKIPSKWKVGFGSAVVGDNKGNVWILSRPRRLPKEDQASAARQLGSRDRGHLAHVAA